MSRFPSQYAESTLKRMHDKLGIADSSLKLLEQYFDAFTGFYRILPLKDAYKIISEQNHDLITEEQFVAFSEIMRHDRPKGRWFWVLGYEELFKDAPKSEPMERMIVDESLIFDGYEDFHELYNAQQGKPLYIPPKSELLRYGDNTYIPNMPEIKALEKFFITKVHTGKRMAGVMAEDCYVNVIMSGVGEVMKSTMALLNLRQISMSMNQLEELVNLMSKLNNNTRLPRNRGYTPTEIAREAFGSEDNIPVNEISFGQNLTDAVKKGSIGSTEIINTVMSSYMSDETKEQMIGKIMEHPLSFGAKVGRNDPCPCGSGKKYKKCCGR